MYTEPGVLSRPRELRNRSVCEAWTRSRAWLGFRLNGIYRVFQSCRSPGEPRETETGPTLHNHVFAFRYPTLLLASPNKYEDHLDPNNLP